MDMAGARKTVAKGGAKKRATKSAPKKTAAPAKGAASKPDPKPAAAPETAASPEGRKAGPDQFGDHAWLTSRRAKGERLPPEPAYVLPESRDEAVTGLKVGELQSMITGAIDVALEDKRRGAPKGNRFWEARTKHGRDPLFKKAQDLRAACTEYFEWVEEHPLHEEVLVTHMGDVWHDTKTKMRAMTLEALCLFIGVTAQTWREWRGRPAVGDQPAVEGRKDLSGVIEWAETVIRTQKFEGAAAGFLNANIISRDLGLADRTAGTLEAGDTLKQFISQISQAPLFGRGA
jgi:hypothetical protein